MGTGTYRDAGASSLQPVWGSEHRGDAQCKPRVLGLMQEPVTSACAVLLLSISPSLPLQLHSSSENHTKGFFPGISQISLGPGFAARLGSVCAPPLWQMWGFTGVFTQSIRPRFPFQFLDVHVFPTAGAGLCWIHSSWDAWHRGQLSVGGFEGGGDCFRLSCYLSDTYQASRSRRPNFSISTEMFSTQQWNIPPFPLPDGAITVFPPKK